jgi:transcriptional regulator with XRE-family HTH domain
MNHGTTQAYFFDSFLLEFWGICRVPKTSGLISEKERQIAARVRQVRYANQLSQPDFSKALGETVNRMASVEYARTPLTVDVADKIGSKFDVSLIWLAHGHGRMKPCIGLMSVCCPEIKGSDLLSKSLTSAAGNKFFEQQRFNFTAMDAILSGRVFLPRGIKQRRFVERFHHDFDALFQSLPHAGKEKLLALALRMLSKFGADWELGKRSSPGENISMRLDKNKALKP